MTTPDSARTHTYHFAKNNNKINRTLSSNQDSYDFHPHLNKISFRYFAEYQQNDKKLNSPQTDLSNHAVLPQKKNHPLKKYAFTVLAKQQKQLRKSEDAQNVRSVVLTHKYPLNLNKTCRNTEGIRNTIENEQQIFLQKHIKQQGKKQITAQNELVFLRKQRVELESNLTSLKAQNELFKVRFEQNKKIRFQQSEQIKRLRTEIKAAELKIRQLSENLIDLKGQKQKSQKQYKDIKTILDYKDSRKQNYKVYQNVYNLNLSISKAIQYQKTKNQQIQTGFQLFEEKYIELMSLVDLNFGIEDYHIKMIRQVKRARFISQENVSLKTSLSEAQKQRSRLLHHLKKNEAEMSKLCNLNAFLNVQMTKSSILIQSCNQEISRLNMRQLQQKMRFKYSFE